MTKIYSWNVNGIRAVVKKGTFQQFVAGHQPDILCLQETKAERGQAEIDLPDYTEYWNSAAKKGYSGAAIFTKPQPLSIVNGLPAHIVEKYNMDDDGYGDPNLEGRVIAAEYEHYWVVTVYTPNAKDDLSRLPLRHDHWDPAFLAYVKALESGDIPSSSDLSGVQGASEARTEPYTKYGEGALQLATPQSAKSSCAGGSANKPTAALRRRGKPVVFCGDLNVAHTELDLANPKPNVGKKGFTDEERAGFQSFLDAGFVDSFRMFTEGNGHYTWWTHWANARARNIGWRIDYVLVSSALKDHVTAAEIHPQVLGSDHCPVSVTLDI